MQELVIQTEKFWDGTNLIEHIFKTNMGERMLPESAVEPARYKTLKPSNEKSTVPSSKGGATTTTTRSPSLTGISTDDTVDTTGSDTPASLAGSGAQTAAAALKWPLPDAVAFKLSLPANEDSTKLSTGTDYSATGYVDADAPGRHSSSVRVSVSKKPRV
jgi:hypothetical protein